MLYMKPDRAITRKILERIEDGFRTPDQVLSCGECGRPIFDLTVEEIKLHMDELVTEGRAELRNQGKIGPSAVGYSTQLYVPKGLPAGTDYNSNRPRGDEMLTAKGER